MLYNLKRKLESKEIQISDLSDEELDEMIELYKRKIKEKKEKLLRYIKLIGQ